MKLKIIAASIALALTTTTLMAAPTGAGMSAAGVLVDGNGMTLYTFDNDQPGVSNCYDGCADSWPPFVAAAGASDDAVFTLVKRTDGSEQWAIKGMPLYYWAGDAAPGDMTGDGVGGVWHVVK